MLKKLYNRSKEDKGNGVLILGIMLIVSGLLIGGMMLDISKAYQLKATYVEAAKKATQAGIREQYSSGGLSEYAAAEAVRVYETVARPSVINDGYFSSCDGVDSGNNKEFSNGIIKNPIIEIVFKDESVRGKDVTYRIKRSDIPDVTKYDKVEDTQEKILNRMDKSGFLRPSHTALEMRITESTPNVILPAAFSITKAGSDSVANITCQTLKIREGASTFRGESGSYE